MKPGPPPPSPDDDASDPLLAALRQRLGDYGQAPPAAAWAAIRQRLPLAPVRPWWRRPQRLLSLLALLLSVVAVGLLAERRGLLPGSAGRRGRSVLAAPPLAERLPGAGPTGAGSPGARAAGQLSAKEVAAATSAAARPAAAGQAANKEFLPASSAAGARLATAPLPRIAATRAADYKEPKMAKNGLLGQATSSMRLVAIQEKSVFSTTPSTRKLAAPQTVAGVASAAKTRRRPHYLAPGAGQTERRARAANRHLATRPVLAMGGAAATDAAAAPLAAAAPQAPPVYTAAAKRRRSPKPLHRPHAWLTTTTQAASRSVRAALGEAPGLAAPAAASRAGRRAPALGAAATNTMGTATAGAAVDSLALGRPVLVLAAGALPATLVAAADSGHPAAWPVRRWSVLVVAGPTLSYRTLGPAPTLAAGQPDFARLERPALGFGAQVQVRRVLSGRWALAVGVGYHEYATRLAISRKDSTTYNTIRQRDTYRLLTVPVQLSYALGAPKGRFSQALLLGLEPGWYQGGRSTEGSTCSCQQQAYASAASSPYRALSLDFSLGLDVRYRLGSTGSRWQWLVQPTGRYVATPFVRSNAVGFTQRQPFSLGLLTGFSWDLR